MAEFVRTNHFLYFALVSKDFRSAWGKRPTEIALVMEETSVTQLQRVTGSSY